MAKNFVDAILAEKEKFTPASGANLVGVDDYEDPGECLYLVGHFATVEAAEQEKANRLAKDPEEKLYVYPAKGA